MRCPPLNRGSIELRPASPLHASLLSGIHRVCFAEAWEPQSMADILAMPGVSSLFAVDGGSLRPSLTSPGPAGLVVWRVAGDEAEILSLAVLPPWRRSGLGARLLEAAAHAARKAGAELLFLEVAVDNNNAQSLYRGRGFIDVGLRRGYYAGKDARVMRRNLPALPACG